MASAHGQRRSFLNVCLYKRLFPLWVDVVEKLVSVEKLGPVEKTDVHNRAVFRRIQRSHLKECGDIA